MCVKKSIYNIYILIAVLACCVRGGDQKESESYRPSRGFVYPPSSVIQFSLGLAVPAQVPNRSIFTNLGTINNVPLPSTLTQLYPFTRTKRSARKITHQYFYHILENIFDSWFFKSISIQKPKKVYENEEYLVNDCVELSICQISSLHNQFSRRSELLFKILHFLFLPSKNSNSKVDSKYLIAERLGLQISQSEFSKWQDCGTAYPSCPLSPLEMVVHID